MKNISYGRKNFFLKKRTKMAKRQIAFILTMILCMNTNAVMAAKQSSTSDEASKRFMETRLMVASGNAYNQAEQTISMGDGHTAAVKENGDLYCWGYNQYGQLGDGTQKDQLKPTKVLSDVVTVALNSVNSAAVTKNGDLYCWGYDDMGQVGDGKSGLNKKPVKVLENVATVALGTRQQSAAVTRGGDLYSWGRNFEGQIGDGTTKCRKTPTKVLSNVDSVVLGHCHSAAITKGGDLYCWGYNEYGKTGTESSQNKPTKVLGNVASVALDGYHSAAVTKDGDLYCWGRNDAGQVGNGTTKEQRTPEKVLEDVVSVSLGGGHSAAITKGGDLYCWGYNYYGEVGDGTTENRLKPKKVLGNVVSAAMGSGISAAITREGDLYCWGNNGPGQIGNGTVEDQLTPCKVLENVASITLGGHSVAANTKAGDLYCWGYNGHGQVGNGTQKNQVFPIKVLSSVRVRNLPVNQDDSAVKDDVKGNEKDSNIDLNIYKANRYVKKGTPSNHTVQSIKDLKYPSQILVDALNKDHGSFEKKVTAWKAVHYAQSPADILNGKLDEKGYYEAIILSIFVSQSDSDGFIGDIIKKANSEANSVLKNVSAWAEKSDSIEVSKISKNQILSTISPEDQAAIREHCAGLFTKNHPLLDNASFITDTLEILFAATDTIGEAIDRMSAYAQLSELSLQQKVVLKKMYGLCPSSNVALKGALAEVAASMDSFDSGLLSAYANAALGQGTNVVGVMVNDAWKAVITANPYAAAFQAGASVGTFIGDKVCSTLFSTDKTVEQYQKMQCLGEFSKLLQQTVEDLKSSYQKEKTKQNARNYLESVETVFAVAYLSCEFAKNYGDIIFQDALVGQLVHTTEDIDAYILTIERTNQNYHEMHAVLETDYLTGLEIDYPQIYGEITGKTVKEDMRESSENLLKKIGVSVDQSSFNIATQKPRIKISFPNGKKPDEYEKSTLKSSNPKVAAIDKGGRITGKKKGKSMITVKVYLKSGSYKQVKFQVTVHEKKATVKKVLTTVVK